MRLEVTALGLVYWYASRVFQVAFKLNLLYLGGASGGRPTHHKAAQRPSGSRRYFDALDNPSNHDRLYRRTRTRCLPQKTEGR